MSRRGFRVSSKAIELRLDDIEREVLADLLGQLIDLIAPEPQPTEQDPLAQLVGIAEHAPRPVDPAVLRLLPDAYRDDDSASADFRRFTEQSLREEKVARARTALDTLDRVTGKQRIVMTRDEGQAWLLALNDLRLAMGTRLGLTQEDADEEATGERPVVYDWLTWLQSTLVDVLAP